VELIHAYSLVHDDMPCMDNDVLRRGKPTVHVQFGEASALLAGDALQALAFELLTPDGWLGAAAPCRPACARLLARAAGCAGMAGGQAIDLASVGLPLTETQLREMHQLKTGALLQASVMMGATVRRSLAAQALSALQGLRRRDWPGFPGGGRHPGRHRRFGHAGQDRRQGRRQRQAHLCVLDGPAGQRSSRRQACWRRRWTALDASGLAEHRRPARLAGMVVNAPVERRAV